MNDNNFLIIVKIRSILIIKGLFITYGRVWEEIQLLWCVLRDIWQSLWFSVCLDVRLKRAERLSEASVVRNILSQSIPSVQLIIQFMTTVLTLNIRNTSQTPLFLGILSYQLPLRIHSSIVWQNNLLFRQTFPSLLLWTNSWDFRLNRI